MNLYTPFILKCTPKVLTQVDRDKHSRTYGCCDRNFWHLKIRDFSSAILQQTGLTMALLYLNDFDGNIFYKDSRVRSWAEASVYFWKKIQLRDGSFNEYYPNEHGFPPTAFSLYSSCEVYKRLNMQDPDLIKAFNRTGNYLINHIEPKAYNQELASITALYSLYTITGEKWVLDGLNKKLERILNLQSPEGWFSEYEGADIGYLSVSLDMLAEYYWMSKNTRVLEPLNQIISFIKYFIHPNHTAGGEYASRNTTYFLPNGLEVMIQLGNPDALAIKNFLFENSGKIGFFMDAVDDRYCSHYLLHSFLRALEKEKTVPFSATPLPFSSPQEIFFKDSGHMVKTISCGSDIIYIIIAAKKGGMFCTWKNDQSSICDFGYRVNYGKGNIAVTNWQDNSYEVQYSDGRLIISGFFNEVSLKVPSPILHLGLRVLSAVLGNKIIGFLKKKIILVNKHSKIHFQRTIEIKDNKLIINESIESPVHVSVEAADNFSARHVASGKFYSIMDMAPHDTAIYHNIRILKLVKEYDLISTDFTYTILKKL